MSILVVKLSATFSQHSFHIFFSIFALYLRIKDTLSKKKPSFAFYCTRTCDSWLNKSILSNLHMCPINLCIYFSYAVLEFSGSANDELRSSLVFLPYSFNSGWYSIVEWFPHKLAYKCNNFRKVLHTVSFIYVAFIWMSSCIVFFFYFSSNVNWNSSWSLRKMHLIENGINCPIASDEYINSECDSNECSIFK